MIVAPRADTGEFDYIIVGAGSAGCVLANRLSEDQNCRVLLLEAGGDDNDIRIKLPLAAISLWFDPAVNWGYLSDPEPHCDQRRLPIPRGKLVGGSSSINGMFFVRGHPRDYERWHELGAAGWRYADVLPFFKSIEADWRGAGAFHGGSGPIRTARCAGEPRLVNPFMSAVDRAGYSRSEDHNGASPEGFGTPDLNVSRGRRVSAAAAFLKPALQRPNLTIKTGAHCTRIIIQGTRARGVEFIRDGHAAKAMTSGEVILTAGAINTPHLLMLSGIGPADQLRALGIVPQVDLPTIGHNLQDHPGTGVNIACSTPFAFDRELRLDRFGLSLARWALFGSGPAANLPVVANAFLRTRADLQQPDLQMIVLSASPFAKPWFPGFRKPAGHMFCTRNILLHPESRGSVTLASGDPMAKPRVQFNLFENNNDLITLRNSIRLTRDLFRTKPLADICGNELGPGQAAQTDTDIDDYIRKTVGTFFHPAGTCAMGSSEDTAVDPELRVRGIEGLRVADASVMPTLPGGNINAPTMMIAEKASSLIRATAAPP